MSTQYKCDECGDTFESEKQLKAHRKLHKLAKKRGKKDVYEPPILHGLPLNVDDVLRVGIGKAMFVIKVKGLTDNPNVVLAEDVYGHTLTINLAKAYLIQRLSLEEYQRRRSAHGEKGKEA